MFVNLTPHMIRIAGVNLETQRAQTLEVPASGKVAIRRPVMGQTTAHRLGQFEFYVSSRSLGNIVVVVRDAMGGEPQEEDFPQPAEGTIYIVSSMVQEGLSRPDVLAPDTGPTAIRKEGQVWAVQGLIGPAQPQQAQ